MSKKHVLYVLMMVALLAATAVSLRQAVSAKAAAMQADRSYDRAVGFGVGRFIPATALQDGKCLEDECSYQLTDGQWVR